MSSALDTQIALEAPSVKRIIELALVLPLTTGKLMGDNDLCMNKSHQSSRYDSVANTS